MPAEAFLEEVNAEAPHMSVYHHPPVPAVWVGRMNIHVSAKRQVVLCDYMRPGYMPRRKKKKEESAHWSRDTRGHDLIFAHHKTIGRNGSDGVFTLTKVLPPDNNGLLGLKT